MKCHLCKKSLGIDRFDQLKREGVDMIIVEKDGYAYSLSKEAYKAFVKHAEAHQDFDLSLVGINLGRIVAKQENTHTWIDGEMIWHDIRRST